MLEAEGTDPKSQCHGFSRAGRAAPAAKVARGRPVRVARPAPLASGADAKEAATAEEAKQSARRRRSKPWPTSAAAPVTESGACKYADKGDQSAEQPSATVTAIWPTSPATARATCGISLSACANGFGCELTSSPGMCRTTCTADIECQIWLLSAQRRLRGAKDRSARPAAATANAAAGIAPAASAARRPAPRPTVATTAGVCKCPDVTCNSGVSCALFYPDVDVDGFGDKNATTATTQTKIGCADTPPSRLRGRQHRLRRQGRERPPRPDRVLHDDEQRRRHLRLQLRRHSGEEHPRIPGRDAASSARRPARQRLLGATSTTCASPTRRPRCHARAKAASARSSSIRPRRKSPCRSARRSARRHLRSIIISLACCGCNDHAGFTTGRRLRDRVQHVHHLRELLPPTGGTHGAARQLERDAEPATEPGQLTRSKM